MKLNSSSIRLLILILLNLYLIFEAIIDKNSGFIILSIIFLEPLIILIKNIIFFMIEGIFATYFRFVQKQINIFKLIKEILLYILVFPIVFLTAFTPLYYAIHTLYNITLAFAHIQPNESIQESINLIFNHSESSKILIGVGILSFNLLNDLIFLLIKVITEIRQKEITGNIVLNENINSINTKSFFSPFAKLLKVSFAILITVFSFVIFGQNEKFILIIFILLNFFFEYRAIEKERNNNEENKVELQYLKN